MPARTVVAGQAYSFAPAALDPDGDLIRFGVDGLPDWLSFNSSNGQLTGTPEDRDVGVYRGIVVWVTDGRTRTQLAPLEIEVLPKTARANHVPVVSGTPPNAIIAGSAYDFLPVATDLDGDSLVFEVENCPRWASFDPATGRLSGFPGSGDVGPYAGIVIRVSDGRDTVELGPFAVSVNPPPIQNRAPLISGSPSPGVVAGQSWSFQPQAADPDGDALSFQVFGAPAWMRLDPDTGQLTGTPDPAAVGTHGGIQLVVSDGEASASLPAFAVAVISPNRPPAINGYPDASIAKGDLYSFTPTASDPDGDTLMFTATGVPAWASFSESTGELRGTAAPSGAYPDIVITVSDGQATTSLPAFSIAVINAPPAISGNPQLSIAVGQSYSFMPTATDPNGDALTFTATGLPAWAGINGSTGEVSGAPASPGAFSNIVIRASDGQASVSLPAFAISVFVPNSTPVIGGSPPASVARNQPYTFTPVASDPDGDALTFTATGLPAWAVIDASTGQVSGTPTTLGTYAGIAIAVSDGQTSATLPTFSVAVVNSAPLIGGTPPPAVLVNTAYSFTPTATDPNGDTLTFTATGLPAWAGIDGLTGQIGGTPPMTGTFSDIVIAVSDGQASTTLPAFSISVEITNSPPVISGSPPGSAPRGQPYSFAPTAIDPNGDTLTFTATGLPDWAVFDGSTGQISGTPLTLGTYANIAITVSDGQAAASLPEFPIVVINTAPVVGGDPPTSIARGQHYSFTATADDANGDALTFTATGLPPWATFNGITGTLSGTASSAGTFAGIVITVSDGQESVSLPAFSIVVANAPPVISGTPPTSIVVGQDYSFTPTASDVDGDTLTFSATGLPAWTAFDIVTGTLSGTAGTAGTFPNIVITASDGQGSASLHAFSIVVVNPPPVIGGMPPTSIATGQIYSFTPTASDPNGDLLTFSATGIPPWASFDDATGRISGTPQSAGTFAGIVVSVSDGHESASLPPFSIDVFPGNLPPIIGGTPPPVVLVGSMYSFTPTAGDPDGDTLTFTAGGIPVWASFNSSTGAMTGTPQAAHVGVYSGISITVSDGAASATIGPFSIQVQSNATGTALLTWVPPTQNADGSPLTDLAGYTVYWGTTPGNYSNSVRLTNPGLTTYLVENLLPGTTYYFVTTAFNSQNQESVFSNVGSKTIP